MCKATGKKNAAAGSRTMTSWKWVCMHACVCLHVYVVCLVNVQGHQHKKLLCRQPGHDLLEVGVHACVCLYGTFGECARTLVKRTQQRAAGP